MKIRRSTVYLPLILSALATANAADRTRSSTTDALNVVGAWNEAAVPTVNDVAIWNASSTLANTAGGALTFGTIDITSAAGAVGITSTNTALTLNNMTLGANNLTLTTGTGTINGTGGISGSGTLQINNSSNTFASFTNLNLTGKLELRGGNASPAPGTMTGNYFILNAATLAQTAGTRFALDTGAAANNARDFGVTTTSLATVNLSSLSGYGAIRSDAGSARTTTYDIDQSGDTTFNGMFLSHTSTAAALRKLALVKGGSGKLTMAGIIGKGTASAGGAASDVDLTVNAGTLELTATNTRTGNTSIGASGTLTVSGTGVLGGSGSYSGLISNAGTVNITSTENQTFSGSVTNNGTLNIGSIGNQTLSGVITGAGSVNKSGSGTLSFTGSSPLYSGGIDLLAGSIRLGPSLGTATLTVRDGSLISCNLAATIGTSTIGALVLEPNTESDFRIGATSDKIAVTGSLTAPASGTHTVNILGTPVAGTIKLIDYSGTPLTNDEFNRFTLGLTPVGAETYQLVNNTADASLDLLVTLESQIWKGTADGNWIDDFTTTNWAKETTPGTPEAFNADHPSLFDDTAALFAVTVDAAGVSPLKTTFNNAANAYTLAGGSIGGSGSLVKNGAAATTLSGPLAYTGGTMVNAGTLTIDGATNTSSGGATITGGKLQIGSGGTTGDIASGAVSVAAGGTIEFKRSNATPGTADLNYKTAAKMRDVSGAGDIVVTGGSLFFNYPGSGTGFSEANSWAGFSGNLIVKGGSEFQTIRNGATAMGSGDIILGDATTSGALSQIEGNWTWTNDISLVGSDNRIRNRSTNPPRTLKLQGVISGSGGLTFEDLTGAMSDANRGFILTNTNTLSGTLTIAAGVPVRVGGVPGNTDASQSGADSFGTLGTAAIVNNGTLTFSRKDAHSVGNAISGTGAVRIGIPAAAALGDTSTQVVTLTGTHTYGGATTVNNGKLVIGSGASIAGLGVTVAANGTLSGTGAVGAPVTAAGTIAPGTGVGTLPVTGNTSLTGSLAVEVDGATGDKLMVTGDLNLSGSSVAVTPVGAGFTAASYVIAECTGTLTGLPTAPTGYQVAAIGNTVVLTQTSGYGAWKTANGTTQTLDGDHDNDGVSNGVEFFIGGPNNTTGFTPLPGISGASITFTKHAGYTGTYGTDFVIETSETLAGTWNQETVGGNVVQSGGSFTYTFPSGGPAKKFVRLKVTGPN